MVKKKKKVHEVYTKEEKYKQTEIIKAKIKHVNMDYLYPEEVEQLYKDMTDYVENNNEYYYETIFKTEKRKLIVCLKNKKRYPISISLPYIDEI